MELYGKGLLFHENNRYMNLVMPCETAPLSLGFAELSRNTVKRKGGKFSWDKSFNQEMDVTPVHQTIVEIFEAQVSHTPQAIAVVYEDQHLTYAELNRRANQLAHFLRKLGV